MKQRNDYGDKLNPIIEDVKNKIIEQYHIKIDKSSIQRLVSEFKDLVDFFENVKLDSKNLSRELFLKRIIDGLRMFNVDIGDGKNVLEIEKNLESSNDKSFDTENFLQDWFDQIQKTIETKFQFIQFVSSLYEKFSSYEIQQDISKYNVADLEDWGKVGKKSGIFISELNIDQFVEKMNSKYKIELKQKKLDESEFKLLNDLLDVSIKYSPESPEITDRIVIKGDFIKLSDIRKAIEKESEKKVEVFAFNKLFIDDDLDCTGKKFKIAMISPVWNIVGDYKISLNGENGESIPSQANENSDGLPGLPGKPAGSFFGIGLEFVKSESLSIEANSGNGGDAQKGGNGSNGENGQSAKSEFENFRGYCKDTKNTVCTKSGLDLRGFWCYCPDKDCCWKSRRWFGNGYDYEQRCTYKIFSKDPTNGKNAGNGGRGGLGAKSGKIEMISLRNENLKIKKSNKDGNPGNDGAGGFGGKGGKKENSVHLNCHYKWRKPTACSDQMKLEDWYLENEEDDPKRGSDGTDGLSGKNDKDIKTPEPAILIEDEAFTISKYKGYLVRESKDRFKRASVLQFSDFLNKNQQVNSFYKTLDLANEFEHLEKNLHKVIKNDHFSSNDVVSFYNALLNRIREYAKSPNENENSIQYKKVLAYLYSTLLSKIYNLETNWDSSLIVDVNGFLDLEIEDIKILKHYQDLKEIDNKDKIIQKYKEEYKIKIDKKIEEGKKLVESEIIPELDNIKEQIDKQIVALVKLVVDLEKEAKKEKKELIEAKKRLKAAIKKQRILSIFGMIGGVVSMLGPYGAIAGSVIGASTSIADVALGDNKQLPLKISEDLKGLTNNLKRLLEMKVTQLKKSLDEMTKEIKSYETNEGSDELNDVLEKVDEIKKKAGESSSKDVKKLEDEMKQELETKIKKLKLKLPNKEKLKKALVTVDKLRKIASMGIDLYNQFKGQNDQLEEIDKAIEEAGEKMEMLKQFENEINDTIQPVLDEMAKNLKQVSDSLDSKSQVSLDITKWKVQSMLRDIKLQMKQVTHGFEIEETLERCMEKEEEAMSTLINIYDRIQNYYDQQTLGNYIADISSPNARKISIEDKKLAETVHNLEIAIRSNLVIKQYETTVAALKQTVFPFAHNYFKELKMSPEFEFEEKIEDLVEKTVKEVEKIKHKLIEYKIAIQNQDEYIHRGHFYSNYTSTEPFFVWSNQELVSRLLSGEEVTARSNIIQSPKDKDAIKFNLIEINFKTKNESMQQEINQILKGFKISAIHMGNSYYRSQNKIFTIISPSQKLFYSFEKDANGEPLDKNDVYIKIKNGDLMLSPYTLWKFRLVKSSKIPFSDLTGYKNQTNLELVGLGSYVESQMDVSGLEIDKYYEVDETLSDLDENQTKKASFRNKLKILSKKLFGHFKNRNEGLVRMGHVLNGYDVPKGNPRIDFTDNNNLIKSNGTIDLNTNLLLGQVLISKIYGPNKNLNLNHYVTPKQERDIELNEIYEKVLPALHIKNKMNCNQSKSYDKWPFYIFFCLVLTLIGAVFTRYSRKSNSTKLDLVEKGFDKIDCDSKKGKGNDDSDVTNSEQLTECQMKIQKFV